MTQILDPPRTARGRKQAGHRRRILVTNGVLLVAWVGLTLLQARMYASRREELWVSDWWVAVYVALAFGGNVPLFGGSVLQRSGRALLAGLGLTAAWLAALVFCSQVLGIHYT